MGWVCGNCACAITARLPALKPNPLISQLLLVHRNEIVARLKSIGYAYVALDLAGFRSGSMNDVIQVQSIEKRP